MCNYAACECDCGCGFGCSVSTITDFVITDPWRNSVQDVPFVVAGRGMPGATVWIAVDCEQAVVSANVDACGHWSVEYAVALQPGCHVLRASQYMCNSCDYFEVPFFVAGDIPVTPTITAPVNGSTIFTQTPVISGYATPGNIATICVDGACAETVIQCNGYFEITYGTPLSYGSHTVTVTQRNPVTGQVSMTATSTFTVAVLP